MAIKKYSCVNCGHTEPFFDHEEKVCVKCQSKDMKRSYGAPLENKITDSADSYRKINVQKGIEKDLKDRSKQHVQDTLDEMIAEFGEQIAKEQGWLIYDETKKKSTPAKYVIIE